jgi:hypothetical protein
MEKTINGLTFKQWYERVDKAVIRIAGVGIDDLSDGLSVDAWREEWTPHEYAIERLENDGFPF